MTTETGRLPASWEWAGLMLLLAVMVVVPLALGGRYIPTVFISILLFFILAPCSI